MTISEIEQFIKAENNDTGPKQKAAFSYMDLIVRAIGDLESYMGALSIREQSFLFTPLRDAEQEIIYKEDGVTPEIDPEIYYDPEVADSHSPSNIFVNKGLRVATGETSGFIESADLLDDLGFPVAEKDVVFIRIDAEISLPAEGDAVNFDVSFDGRETWLVADYGATITLTDGTTGFIDVSRYPSSKVALKWSLTGTALVRSTIFSRLYIPKEKLRHYGADVVELAKLRILEMKYAKAVENGNDPIVIAGIVGQINLIRGKYGLNKNGGDIKPIANNHGIQAFRTSREEQSIMGAGVASDTAILADNRVVSIKSDGTVRRI